MSEPSRILGDLELQEIARAEREVRAMHFELPADERAKNALVDRYARWAEEAPGYVRCLLATVTYWRNRATKD